MSLKEEAADLFFMRERLTDQIASVNQRLRTIAKVLNDEKNNDTGKNPPLVEPKKKNTKQLLQGKK